MKTPIIALCLILAASHAFAKDEKTATPQQSKKAACNKEAKEKTLQGADRQAFMQSCLRSDTATADEPKKALRPQQQRMQNCNKEAKEKALKGPERKQFMSACLKSKAPTQAKE